MTKKVKLFEEFIAEANIGTIVDKITIELDLDTTNHAEERKNRHGDDDPITNDEIIQTVDKAFDTIAENRIKNEDKLGRKYWIYDKSNRDLNVVGILTLKNKELVFVVITVMREKDFRGSTDAKKIEV